MDFRVEPEVCPVDQPVEVRVTATLDRPLRAGDRLAFALPEAWSSEPYCITFTRELQHVDPQKPNYVSVTAEGASFGLSLEPIRLPSGANKGHVRKIVATLRRGELQPGEKVLLWLHKSRSTWLAEAGALRIWVGDEEQKGAPRLRTLPGEAEKLRVIVPSSAKPGVPFRVNIVSYDRFWNRSASTYRDGILRLEDGSILETGIAFTGSYTTTATIAEPGVYRLRYQQERSNPIRITAEPQGPCWGDLHSHDKVHNCGAGEDPYTYAREVSCLDFVAVCPDFRGLSQDVWHQHVLRAEEANDPQHFTAILAYEAGFRQGHYNIYFRGGDGHIFDVSDQSLHSMDHLLPTLNPEDVFIVPHHLGIDWCCQAGYPPEWDPWVPLLEIYSQHGLSESYSPEHVLSYEFNRTRGLEDKYATSLNRSVYARDAWSQGRRFGVIASSDDHMGQPGKSVKGLAAVFSPQNTREALFQSLKARKAYGTTGERILLDFRINGHEMGQEIFVDGEDPLTVEVEVHGTDEIAFIEVARLRLGEESWESAFSDRLVDRNLFHEQPGESNLDYATRFEELFTSDAVYYLRVTQRRQLDGWPVFAWSSPIWVTQKR
jgi:hypothetical protein